MISIKEYYSLANLNTFHDSYTCRYFIESDDLFEWVDFLDSHRIHQYLIIGQGSNILFTKPFKGAIFRPMLYGKHIIAETTNTATVLIGASENFDDVINWTLSQHLYGLENLSSIPGTMGAAPVQNIGAYGREIKDFIESVQCFDLYENTFITFSKKNCRFGYRDSIFKQQPGRYLIVAVSLLLQKTPQLKADYPGLETFIDTMFNGKWTPQHLREAIIAIRQDKLPSPSTYPNAGSFFKNPIIPKSHFEYLQQQFEDIPHYHQDNGVKIPAAWCIDKAGWKGKAINGVTAYHKQPLILVKTSFDVEGKAVVEYATKVIESVKSLLGITLVPEVNIF